VTQGAQREYVAELRQRYRAASRREKGHILDEYCRVTKSHRKSAIRALRARPAGGAARPGRPRRYGPELGAVLERLWEVSGRLCGTLLAPLLPTLLPALERHEAWVVPPAQRAQVLQASAATLERFLRRLRARRGRQPRRGSGPPLGLKAQVPIRTWGEWGAVPPGSLQGDLVLHCGERTGGFFLATLLAIDVATSWTDFEPIWGLGYRRVHSGVHAIRGRLPFALRHWHTDNGGEFINHILIPWCRQEGIGYSRGRAYRKNDQAYAEQRNWLAIRRVVGYDRYSSHAAQAALQRLYRPLRLHINFFRPVRKLISKVRHGSKVSKRYDAAQTPYQRVLAAGCLTPAQTVALRQQFESLNPAALTRDIEAALEALWRTREARQPGARPARVG
jgi:hypothetical protein